MTDHPYQPGTKWAPKRGSGKPRTVVEPRKDIHPQIPAGSWFDEFLKRPDIIWYAEADWPVTLATFRRWAGEQVG